MLNPKSENRSEKARIPRETLRKVKNPDLLYPELSYDEKIILEIKYLPILTAKEKRQAWHYLKGSQYKLLLLVNFGGRKLEIKRWIYDKARNKS